MRRLILVILLTALSNLPATAISAWTPIAEQLRASVVFLEVCTGFVIDSKRHYVLTAAHCLPDEGQGERMTVDGTSGYKIFVDHRKDLAVLRAGAVDRPALRLADRDPDFGDEVASMGYGHALEQPMFRVAHISHNRFEIEELSGPFVVVDADFIPGQSGGPIVNAKGEVVAIVQRTGNGLGIGVGRDTLKDRVGRYFEEGK